MTIQLQKPPLVIIGYGSQAKAWAANLTDSGYQIFIALRKKSSSWEIAKSKGYKVVDLESDELANFPVFINLTPDHTHEEIITNLNELKPDATVIYAHGYSYDRFNFNKSFSRMNHILLAPKAIASEVRFQYENNGPIGGAYSLEGVNSNAEYWKIFTLELAKDLGINAGPYECSFRDETVADLFSEQSILCSLLPYAAKHSFDELVSSGISKEIAYLECWYEVKLIADTLMKLGPEKFFELISPNALIGGEKAYQLFFDNEYQKKLKKLLEDNKSGQFYREIDQSDVEEIRKKILARWVDSDLNLTHQNLKNELYEKTQHTSDQKK